MSFLGVYGIGIGVGALSTCLLLIMQLFVRPSIFFGGAVLWLLVLFALHAFLARTIGRGRDLFFLSLATALSILGLTTLIEWQALQWFLALMGGAALGVIYLPGAGMPTAPHVQKIFRRFFTMLWVFDTYALLTFLFAMNLFFPSVRFWTLDIGIGFLASGSAFMIWRLYYVLPVRRGILWIILLTLLMVELGWVMQVLPFGYLASGLLLTWLWYILQLLVRFHFAPQDILWRRQWKFLTANAVLYFITLVFFVRWV